MAGAPLSDGAVHSQMEVEYNPLWLELRKKQEPAQGGMHLAV